MRRRARSRSVNVEPPLLLYQELKVYLLFLVNLELEDVKEEWLRTEAPHHIQMAAEHYGVYKDLFGDGYFTPYVALDVAFKQSDGKLAPVYRGNVVKPSESASAPNIDFPSKPDELWTLVLTNPDGHLTEENKEYVHWFV